MRAKFDTVLGQLSEVRQRKYLESAGICQQRSPPRGEIMQPAEMLDHIDARPEKQVICIAEDDSSVKFVLEPFEPNALNRALRTDRHKNGRFDHGPSRRDRPCTSVSIFGRYFPIDRLHK